MDKIEICKKIKQSIRHLILFSDNDIIGSGTGIIVKDTGELITANHVIADYQALPNSKIITSGASGVGNIQQIEYKSLLSNIALNIGMPSYTKPLEIDLAILGPVEKIKKAPFIEMENNIVSEGEEVIMAGFPDEIKPPLNFDKMLNFDNPDLASQKSKIDDFFKHLMSLIMMKSGMVGSVQKINIIGNKVDIPNFDKKTIDVKGAVYWIDNSSTYGASGGPVINSSGKLIGIISEKGMTEQEMGLKVPSGSTMALSHRLITWFLGNS